MSTKKQLTKQVAFRLSSSVLFQIDREVSRQRKSKTAPGRISRTSVVEYLLWLGIQTAHPGG